FYNGFNDSQMNLIPHFNADLVMMHKSKIHMMKSADLNKYIVHQTLAFDEVEEAIPINMNTRSFRNQSTGMVYDIGIIAFPVDTLPFKAKGLAENIKTLRNKNTVLFDSLSRKIYGKVKKGQELEIADRKFKVGGLIEFGPNFTRNGWVIMSDSNWLRITPEPHYVNFGLIRAKPGTDLQELKRKICNLNPGEVIAFTAEEQKKRDKHFWTTATPFGIVFGTGLVIGFLIGVMICYQILFNEITDHMDQYATLKAIGFSNAFIVGVVMRISLLYSVFGFFPGLAGGWGLYRIIESLTRIEMFLTFNRIILILVFTVLMSIFSGLLAVVKVIQADPAEVF
ncbi:MAG: FtsX-like permease family protein, partial [Nitrospina sp.]|nr:FtsX-like permease family protein [Nitrospina sp.]